MLQPNVFLGKIIFIFLYSNVYRVDKCPYKRKLLNLGKVTDFMKFITYPINLNKAFLLCDQRYHSAYIIDYSVLNVY